VAAAPGAFGPLVGIEPLSETESDGAPVLEVGATVVVAAAADAVLVDDVVVPGTESVVAGVDDEVVGGSVVEGVSVVVVASVVGGGSVVAGAVDPSVVLGGAVVVVVVWVVVVVDDVVVVSGTVVVVVLVVVVVELAGSFTKISVTYSRPLPSTVPIPTCAVPRRVHERGVERIHGSTDSHVLTEPLPPRSDAVRHGAEFVGGGVVDLAVGGHLLGVASRIGGESREYGEGVQPVGGPICIDLRDEGAFARAGDRDGPGDQEQGHRDDKRDAPTGDHRGSEPSSGRYRLPG
jgi:hypothetical protein